MRSGDYLIIRWQSGYEALYGPQCERVSLGYFPTAAEAQEAGELHRQKNPEAP
jgi:hypothetical protein